jgi:hypothetical protein
MEKVQLRFFTLRKVAVVGHKLDRQSTLIHDRQLRVYVSCPYAFKRHTKTTNGWIETEYRAFLTLSELRWIDSFTFRSIYYKRTRHRHAPERRLRGPPGSIWLCTLPGTPALQSSSPYLVTILTQLAKFATNGLCTSIIRNFIKTRGVISQIKQD